VALAMAAGRFHEIGADTAARRVMYAAEGVALRMEGKGS